MGSTSSKFKKNLQQGDEYAAMKIYQNSPELRKFLNPNLSYGQHHHHNTALHYAAKHGMKHLLRAFLNELGGNPNRKNTFHETVLHCACGIIRRSNNYSTQERRAACVQLIVLWKGRIGNNGGRERVDLDAQDQTGNSALHLAAMFGLKKCVEILVNAGADLFIENEDKCTPCDLAMREGHENIAIFLEGKMVFTNDPNEFVDDQGLLEIDEDYKGLRSQDLQEAKDQLLIDTSDMLKVPLFTAEALLRANEWSKEHLLEQWMKDPTKCCQIAGVHVPNYAESIHSSCNSTETETNNQNIIICEICLNHIPLGCDDSLKMSCKHIFCKSCWQNYFNTKIQNGNTHHILCPAYQCHLLVPVDFIEKIVSPKTARRYLQFDIDAFVESNRTIKWCPIPSCGRAVTLSDRRIKYAGQSNYEPHSNLMPHAVDCGNFHLFCWECLGEAHEPCPCDLWKKWQKKIAEIKPEQLNSKCAGSEEAANCLWLVTNSKPCPNCKSPIQKNEGCNHMKCSKCRYDFCWVCQESWKRHSSITGGYFRCNRFEAVKRADEKQGILLSQVLEKNNEIQRASKFVHHYTRYKNHDNSEKMEEPLLRNVKRKMEILVNSLGIQQEEAIQSSTKFIEDGIRELLKARRVLCGSYVYLYYSEEETSHNGENFIQMQHDVERQVETLSGMIARPYICTPKSTIVAATTLTRLTRLIFVRAVYGSHSLVSDMLLLPPVSQPVFLSKDEPSKMTIQSYGWATSVSTTGCDIDYDSDINDDHNGWSVAIRHLIRHQFNEHRDEELQRTHMKKVDYNMELTIGMSRLQMVNDYLQKTQQQLQIPVETKQCSSRTATVTDEQINLAIHLSREEAIARRHKEMEEEERKNNAEFTINYFLKSLAQHNKMHQLIDRKSFDHDTNSIFQPRKGHDEDGRFKISDIHEKGFPFNNDEFDEKISVLKRSHSTGDLSLHSTKNIRSIHRTDESPRYTLDTDHTILHKDKLEDLNTTDLAFPSTSLQTRQLLLVEETDQKNEFIDRAHDSVNDNSNTYDSIKADMEVCGILSTINDQNLSQDENETKKTDLKLAKNIDYNKPCSRNNSFTNIKAKLCTTTTHLPASNCFPKVAINKSLGLISNESKPKSKQYKGYVSNTNEKACTSKSCSINRPTVISGESKSEKPSPKNRQHLPNNNLSKSTEFLLNNQENGLSSQLRIQISKNTKKTTIETDSSNEYESETGIPKSPTIFISGVSISRTPEPNSPGLYLIHQNSGRQSRSSSLSVPKAKSLKSSCSLSISCNSLNNKPFYSEPSLFSSPTIVSSQSNLNTSCTSPFLVSSLCKDISESKSANEPERDKEVFRFPKSSTDGALSSVLHVRESNLSSDDFHEALFLLERSPKSRDSSRKRRRSKKKEKDETNNKDIVVDMSKDTGNNNQNL